MQRTTVAVWMIAALSSAAEAAPGVVLDCQMSEVPGPPGFIRIEIDFLNSTLDTVYRGASTRYEIFEQTPERIRGKAGEHRILIDRRTGDLIIGVPDKNVAFAGRCTIGKDKLF